MTTIRTAGPADIDGLSRLWFDGWRDAHLALVPPGLSSRGVA